MKFVHSQFISSARMIKMLFSLVSFTKLHKIKRQHLFFGLLCNFASLYLESFMVFSAELKEKKYVSTQYNIVKILTLVFFCAPSLILDVLFEFLPSHPALLGHSTSSGGFSSMLMGSAPLSAVFQLFQQFVQLVFSAVESFTGSAV